MTTTRWVGWLILALALALPGVLFIQWRGRLGDGQKREVDYRLRSRAPDQGTFAVSAKKDKLVNPIASSAPQPAAAPSLTAALAAGPLPLPAPPAVSSPWLDRRDPTISPGDLQRLEQLEKYAQLAKASLSETVRKVRVSRPKSAPPKPEQLVDLQGIVLGDDGSHAMVNGGTYREGDQVPTAAGPVKVLRITAQAVTFGALKQRFTKSFVQ